MRQATNTDLPAIEKAYNRLLESSNAEHMKHADKDTALQYIQEAISIGHAWFYDGYFILFDIGSPWFSKTKMLIEEIIIRVYPTSEPVENAIKALDKLRDEFGCMAVAVGDTQIGHMSLKYISQGYKVLGTQLMKDAPTWDGFAK